MQNKNLAAAAGKVACLATLLVFSAVTLAIAHDAPQTQHAPAAHSGTAAQAIEHAMKRQFDKPQSPLRVNPISIEGDFAVAGWTQDQRGGRALLKKDKGQWVIELCAGDGLKQVATLTLAGVPAQAAQSLSGKMAAAEKKLPADVVRKFSLFEGVVKVEGGVHGAHPEHK